MSAEHAAALRTVHQVFVDARRAHIQEAVRTLERGNAVAAMINARRALDLQPGIEALDRAIADEMDEGYLPKGAI
jgi:hypothetical protein